MLLPGTANVSPSLSRRSSQYQLPTQVFLCVAGDEQSSEKRGQPDLQLHCSVQDTAKWCFQQDSCVSGWEASFLSTWTIVNSQVFDKDTFSKDDPLGEVQIPLWHLDINKVGHVPLAVLHQLSPQHFPTRLPLFNPSLLAANRGLDRPALSDGKQRQVN